MVEDNFVMFATDMARAKLIPKMNSVMTWNLSPYTSLVMIISRNFKPTIVIRIQLAMPIKAIAKAGPYGKVF